MTQDINFPPRDVRSEEFEAWCGELRRRGYSVWAMAQRAGVSENRVLRASERWEAGRAHDSR